MCAVECIYCQLGINFMCTTNYNEESFRTKNCTTNLSLIILLTETAVGQFSLFITFTELPNIN